MENLLNILKNYKSQLHKYFRLIDIFEGNLVEYVIQAMREELSDTSFKVASKRVTAINLFRRMIKKLSRVYTIEPKRTCVDEKDQELVSRYAKELGIQNIMSSGEDMLNINKCFAIEPYISDNHIQLRILSPHEFRVIGEDENNPMKVTKFVKFMGSEKDSEGKLVDIYWVYSSEFLVVVDSNGRILQTYENPYKVIPFVYVNSSTNFLVPKPDEDSFQNSILIPKLLADLNYATQFQSHSIMYSIDAEIRGSAKGTPDSMWNLSSVDGENKTPQVGVLSPSVDTEKVLSLIAFTVSQWLESRGIAPGAIGKPDAQLSGISKIVDESNVEQVVQENRLILIEAEQRLWALIGLMHNYNLEDIMEPVAFSYPLDVSIAFPIQQIVNSPQEQRDELKFKLENKLISKKRALKQANPELNDEELAILQKEIDEEQAKVQEAFTPPTLNKPANLLKNDNNIEKP